MQFLIGAYLWISFAGFYCLGGHVAWVRRAIDFAFDRGTGDRLQPLPLMTTWVGNWESVRADAPILVYPLLFVFIPTLLMGASFPLVASLALRRSDREGSTVGTVYFFNILGNVAGGIVTGYWLLGVFGTERSALGLSLVGLSALLLVDRFLGWRPRPAWRAAAFAVLAAAAVLTFPGRGEFYKLVHGKPEEGRVRYVAEGVDSVVVTDHGDNGTFNWINGLAHGDCPDSLYASEVFEAFSYAPNCREVLVIGFGAGTFVENALMLDEVEHVSLVDVNASVIENFSKIPEFKKLITDPRVSLTIDDGRRFLLQTDQTYDMVLIDPLRTTTAYSNNLYSREFFELVKKHLKPEGLFLAWTDDEFVFPHTMAEVFPAVRLYWMTDYTNFCLALNSNGPFVRNDQRAEVLFAKYSPAMQDDVPDTAYYLGDESYIARVTAGYPTSRDWKPVMEYYLWRNFQRKSWKADGE
jgi:spermidine synthase